MAINIAAALACASLIFGLPNAQPERPLTVVASQTMLDRLCTQYGNEHTRRAGGCEAAFIVLAPDHEYIVTRSAHIDWETQVAESCHALQHRNGLPQSETQCHHDSSWSRFYRSRIGLCTQVGLKP
jgi:hypothetical protein